MKIVLWHREFHIVHCIVPENRSPFSYLLKMNKTDGHVMPTAKYTNAFHVFEQVSVSTFMFMTEILISITSLGGNGRQQGIRTTPGMVSIEI